MMFMSDKQNKHTKFLISNTRSNETKELADKKNLKPQSCYHVIVIMTPCRFLPLATFELDLPSFNWMTTYSD